MCHSFKLPPRQISLLCLNMKVSYLCACTTSHPNLRTTTWDFVPSRSLWLCQNRSHRFFRQWLPRQSSLNHSFDFLAHTFHPSLHSGNREISIMRSTFSNTSHTCTRTFIIAEGSLCTLYLELPSERIKRISSTPIKSIIWGTKEIKALSRKRFSGGELDSTYPHIISWEVTTLQLILDIQR